MKKLNLLSLTFLLMLLSCENVIKSPEEEQSNGNTFLLKSSAIQSTYFDWETVNDYNGLPMPWLGSGSFIPDSWRHDHKREDGWELLYNNLDCPTYSTSKSFALYNKYYGVVRIFYINTGNDYSGQQYALAVKVHGNTRILNLEQGENISIENNCNILSNFNDATVFKTQPLIMGNIPASGGFTKGAWYGTEIDLMYQDVSNLNDIYFQLLPYAVKLDSLVLISNTTGTINGSITGTISASPSGTNISTFGGVALDLSKSSSNVSTINNNNVTGAGAIVENSLKEAKKKRPKFFNRLWNKVVEGASGATIDGVGDLAEGLIKSGIDWATNPLAALGKKIFGGGNTSVQHVNFDVKMGIKTYTITRGTITSDSPLPPFIIPLPISNQTVGGLMPTEKMENYPLGVWTLTEAPRLKVERHTLFYTNPLAKHSFQCTYKFSIENENSVDIIFNPKVLEECDLEAVNIKYTWAIPNYASNYEFCASQCTPHRYEENREFYYISGKKLLVFLDDGYEDFDKFSLHLTFTLKDKVTGMRFSTMRTIPITDIIYKDTKAYSGGGNELTPME